MKVIKAIKFTQEEREAIKVVDGLINQLCTRRICELCPFANDCNKVSDEDGVIYKLLLKMIAS